MRFDVRMLVTTALLLVCGCNKSAPAPAGKAAGAQVLPGTISDAMIDLDQSQSHPLLNPDQSKHATVGEIMGEKPSDDAGDDAAAPDVDAPPAKPAAAE